MMETKVETDNKLAEQQLASQVNTFVQSHNLRKLGDDFDQPLSFDEFLSDKMLVINAIRSGIPYPLFHLIQNLSPFSDTDWAAFLDISTKSLQRYRAADDFNFKPIHSEKIIEIAEVTRVGTEVFGELDKFKTWLHMPNFALGNATPFDLLRDSYGKELVLGELHRINYGILS